MNYEKLNNPRPVEAISVEAISVEAISVEAIREAPLSKGESALLLSALFALAVSLASFTTL